MTPPRWRCACACFCFLASCSLSRRFCSARLRFSVSFSALASARFPRASCLGASGVSSAASGAPTAMPGLDRLDLGDVAGDRDLGVVLGARLAGRARRRRACAPALRGPAARPCAVRASWPSGLARLLVRRVLAAPAAELAQLDPVRRVAPRLVGLVVASLAVFASHRHRDADISASHFSLDYLRAITRKNPGPRHEAEPKNSALGY